MIKTAVKRLESLKAQYETERAELVRLRTAPIVQDNLETALVTAAVELCGTKNVFFSVPSTERILQSIAEGAGKVLPAH